jgi:hypothetical protein
MPERLAHKIYSDEVDSNGKITEHSWPSVQHKFRRVSQRSKIYRFRQYITNKGTKVCEIGRSEQIHLGKILSGNEMKSSRS